MHKTLLAITLMTTSAALGGVELHVAPTGKDTHSGKADAPFATLARARDAIRELKQNTGLPDGGVTIWVRGGRYEMAETFALGEQDSGAAGKPVIYRAAEGAEVRLLGGRTLPADQFGLSTDNAARNRIPEAARGGVRVSDLKALGIDKLGKVPDAFTQPPLVSELFLDDERMTLARWPNDDWTTIESVVDGGVPKGKRYSAVRPGTFVYKGDRPKRWASAPDVWLHGYWCFDWKSETIKIGKLDTDKRRITLGKTHCYGVGGGNPAPRRYYAVNLLEELDAPGEYYIDRTTGLLYFWPPKPLAESRIVLSTLAEPVISLDGASHVILRGLTIETTVGTGIRIKGGRENRIAACCVRNTGRDAIVVEGGEKHVVVACDIHDTGTAGLRLSGGDRKTLTPCGHQAINNHIWRVSRRQRTHAYHVHLRGVGIRLAHNRLHHAPHQSIGLTGNDHVIELNEIHHVGMASDDCGAFYMGRNPSERGTVLRHNYWHDIGSSFTHGSCAVYFDDGTGGQTVYGNVFYRAAGGNFGAVFVHGGHDNHVENNIFIECRLALGHAPWNNKRWREWLQGDLWKKRLLQDVDITKPPYSERYPELKGFMKPSDEPRLNRAYRNVMVRCTALVSGNWALLDNKVYRSNPDFVDTEARNFALKPDSRVFREVPGFKPIPFDKIGLQRDGLRPKLPSE